jgi:hypothetical protein
VLLLLILFLRSLSVTAVVLTFYYNAISFSFFFAY